MLINNLPKMNSIQQTQKQNTNVSNQKAISDSVSFGAHVGSAFNGEAILNRCTKLAAELLEKAGDFDWTQKMNKEPGFLKTLLGAKPKNDIIAETFHPDHGKVKVYLSNKSHVKLGFKHWNKSYQEEILSTGNKIKAGIKIGENTVAEEVDKNSTIFKLAESVLKKAYPNGQFEEKLAKIESEAAISKNAVNPNNYPQV